MFPAINFPASTVGFIFREQAKRRQAELIKGDALFSVTHRPFVFES
jgi:ferric-dicitrate binding protein FerR (iron transport regulator)